MQHITYEQPLNERIRTFLRLEFCSARRTIRSPAIPPGTAAARRQSDRDSERLRPWRSEDRSHQGTGRLAARWRGWNTIPTSTAASCEILDRIDVLVDRLYRCRDRWGRTKTTSSPPSSSAPPFLAVPAISTCPRIITGCKSLRPPRCGLRQWLSSFDNFRAAIDLILGMVRESASESRETATAGFYQKSLDTSVPYQLIRVTLPVGAIVSPKSAAANTVSLCA